jgi:hypothetical protein
MRKIVDWERRDLSFIWEVRDYDLRDEKKKFSLELGLRNCSRYKTSKITGVFSFGARKRERPEMLLLSF